ncbi:MAG TPA: HDIG domain-containing protein [Pyrinomonadaceae bacterium]|jgi:putative nucleotidyltransferase with HDIG domain|nr:HDIG domain-containing protein [Pyrinomonadaceae bacterium]
MSSKKLPNLTSPMTRLRTQAARYISRPFKVLSEKQRFWLGFSVLLFLVTLLVANPFFRSGGEIYHEKDVIRETIVSPADITEADLLTTERERQAARNTQAPIFTFEGSRAEQAVSNFRSAWSGMVQKVEPSNSNARSSNGKAANNGNTRVEVWKNEDGEAVTKVFLARQFTSNELEAITRALREAAEGSIYDDKDAPNFQDDILLVDRKNPNQQSSVRMPENSMTSLSQAREKLRQKLAQVPSLSGKEIDAFQSALSSFIQPSVAYDSPATENARDKNAQAIMPTIISLKRGDIIARQGDEVTPEILSKLNAVRSYTTNTRQWNRFLGLLALIGALFWGAWKFIEHRGMTTRLVQAPEKTFALFGFIVLAQTIVMSLCVQLANFTAAQNARPPFNDPTLWSLAIPFALTSLTMTLLADRQIALFSGLFVAFLAGLMAPKGLEFAIFAAITSITAVYGIGRYRTRQAITIAGLMVGIAGALCSVALIGYMQLPFILNTVLLAMACGIIGGLITAALTAVIMPLCESLFGVLTDVKLLELSNADLPVLGQLALRAPGTNQHSHAVGQLAHEACRAIGANPLLAKIGALYHDIGKVASPEHYVENQLGKNPHDRLKPVQSAKIIISHVTYGVKLAKEIGLPQRVIDFIPQHHGTRTLHYFLRKAQTEAGEGVEVEESDFRYPGPKPQFKEAAVMMIADSCEAAARSLAQPTPENIRFIITKIIDAILSDDQLDECDLTLRELTILRESMIKSLVAIYHSRIDYPGYVPPSQSLANIILPAAPIDAAEDAEERGIKYQNPADIPVSKGGEIEDEAIDRSHEPTEAKAEAKTVK